MKLGIPVIAVNEMDRLPRALEVLNEKRATLVAVGRGLIADPDWPIKVREGRLDDIIVCTGCDECHTDLNRGAVVGCAQWN
jgi:2,4-dienoyl-CoA reductase-like NADH-dependent reductase (Old Yellow Enzyme family)